MTEKEIPELTDEQMQWMSDSLENFEENAIEGEGIHPVNMALFLDAYVQHTKKQIVKAYSEMGAPPEKVAQALGADISVAEVNREDIPEELAEQLDEAVEAAAPDEGGVIDADDIDPELMEQVVEALHESDDDPRGFQ